jgi:hypothetical protein
MDPTTSSRRALARRTLAGVLAATALAATVALTSSGAGAALRPLPSESCSTSTTTSTLVPNLRNHGLPSDCLPPSAPVLLSVTRAGATVTASWAPGYDPTAWYLCTLVAGANVTSTTVRTAYDHCTFTGLNPRGHYAVRVVAQNPYGTSTVVQGTAPNPKVVRITCVRATVVSHVTGVNPRCPAGFHRA